MARTQPKNMIILYILKILQKHSDENHRLTQDEIKQILENEYDMKVERKTIKRNMKNLINYGYRDDANEIMYNVTERKVADKETGKRKIIKVLSDFGLIHDFTDSELRLIIESLLFSKHISKSNREELIKKLEGLASTYFNSRIDHIRTIPDNGHKNSNLFLNIEKLDEAISKSKQVSFNYNKYRLNNLKLQLEEQLNKGGSKREYIVNPYQIVAANGKYYLICNYDKYDNVSHYRLDRMTNIKVLNTQRKPMKEVKGLERGLDLPKHMAEHIYMFTGESHSVTLRFKKDFLNEFVDWFGTSNVRFFDEEGDEVSARVIVNRIAMKKWALQYGLHVRVLSPESLVDEIKEDIRSVVEKYK